MKLPSVMPPQKNFALVPQIEGQMQRSVFNRSHAHKTTFDVDYLVPFYVDEILPGDTQDLKAHIFARISSPLDHPIMDNLFIDTFFFFVPNRLVWDNWEKFMGAQANPGDSIDYVIPKVTVPATGFAVGSIYDYFGIPTGVHVDNSSTVISNLYARAYNLIYNEWFRDENLQNSVTVDKGNGPDTASNYNLLRRGKFHDYFTSCLPWPQKGAAVTLPLGGTAPVYGDGKTLGFTNGLATPDLMGMYYNNSSNSAENRLRVRTAAYNQTLPYAAASGSSGQTDLRGLGIVPKPGVSGIYADLSEATAILINDLRTAVATQQFLEQDARGGTRYVELLKSHFGVISPDFRLQRPEYLGGGTNIVNINPVTQLASSGLGTQGAFGTLSSKSGYSKSFVEHGIVIGIANVRADLTYQQGLNKKFTRSTRAEFYFPVFANLGEQAVLNREIFYQDSATPDTGVFGYQERWAEYRFFPSRISGKFRSDVSGTLDSWHLSQDFATLPTLNTTFIQATTPMGRVTTIDTEPNIFFDSFIELRHARPIPVYSVPGLKRF